MKNKSTVILIVIIFSISFLAVGAFFSLNYIKNRFYSGDRITGTFNMTVTGHEYDPVDETLEYDNGGTQRLTSSGSNFSIKGNEYGGYKIGFVLDNKEIYHLTKDNKFKTYTDNPSITYYYIKTSWWKVTKMKLTAELAFIDDQWIVKTKAVYSETKENGGNKEKSTEKTFSYDEIMSGNEILQFGL